MCRLLLVGRSRASRLSAEPELPRLQRSVGHNGIRPFQALKGVYFTRLAACARSTPTSRLGLWLCARICFTRRAGARVRCEQPTRRHPQPASLWPSGTPTSRKWATAPPRRPPGTPSPTSCRLLRPECAVAPACPPGGGDGPQQRQGLRWRGPPSCCHWSLMRNTCDYP